MSELLQSLHWSRSHNDRATLPERPLSIMPRRSWRNVHGPPLAATRASEASSAGASDAMIVEDAPPDTDALDGESLWTF